MESKWLFCVQKHLSAESRRAKGKSFFKVPAHMRGRQNKQEYEPIFFTFGPYHAKLPSPCDYFKLQAATALTSVASFEKLVAQIKRKYSDIRDMYAEPWDHMGEDAEALAHLLALDALTIVGAASGIEIFQPHNLVFAVFHDAWLLDNQLPLFVLQYAIESIVQFVDNLPSMESVVRAYAINYSDSPFSHDGSWSWSVLFNPNQSMIGCAYDILTGRTSQSIVTRQDPGCWAPALDQKLPTASQLRKYGITFAPCYAGRFTEISFNQRTRVLTLPKISLYDGTASYLLNLAAYEVGSFPFSERPISSYIEMMDYLINEVEDVKLLDDSRVIENQLGSHEEAASIWNKMAFSLPHANTQKDKEVIKKVNEACMSKWHKLKTAFLDEYLNKKPWLLISIISAFVLLVLTLLQTIYSIQLYYFTIKV